MDTTQAELAERASTFPFDLIEVDCRHGETVKLLRDFDKDMREQAEQFAAEHDLRVRAVHAIVERHECDYKRCTCCLDTTLAGLMSAREVYDTPWDDKARLVQFCCNKCEEAYLDESDFCYRYCDDCGRLICVRNPANGYQTHFRDVDDGPCEEICLKCYQDRMIANGLTYEQIQAKACPGMFFDTEALEAAGYQKMVPAMLVNSKTRRDLTLEALKLYDGHKVLFDWERLSIVGNEGWVSVWAKPLDKSEAAS